MKYPHPDGGSYGRVFFLEMLITVLHGGCDVSHASCFVTHCAN